MGARKHVLGTVVALFAAGLAIVPARAVTLAGRFLVGAARVDITPPMQPSDFPRCPPLVFTGERRFAFEEPYVDVQHLGHYEYPDPFCDANGNGRYDGVLVSATHNESSPDPIGIYGAPDTGQGFGLRSGIDDYYMDFLVDRAARAAAAAFDARRPATLAVTQVPVPPTVRVALSDNFPTPCPHNPVAAVDP